MKIKTYTVWLEMSNGMYMLLASEEDQKIAVAKARERMIAELQQDYNRGYRNDRMNNNVFIMRTMHQISKAGLRAELKLETPPTQREMLVSQLIASGRTHRQAVKEVSRRGKS